MTVEDNFLEHHGVKGMKWGKRKARDSGGTSSKKTTTRDGYNKADVKTLSKMSKGEKAASAMFGPGVVLGLSVYKAGKIGAAKRDLDASGGNVKAAQARAAERKAAAKMTKGEKAITFIFAGGPAGMAMYKGGKIIGATVGQNHRDKMARAVGS